MGRTKMRKGTVAVLTAATAAAVGTVAVIRARATDERMRPPALRDEGGGYPVVIHRFDGFAALHTASFTAVRDLLPTDLLHPVRAPNGRALVLVGLYRKHAPTAGVGAAAVVLPPYVELPVVAVVSRRPLSLVGSALALLRSDSDLGGLPIQFPMTSQVWRDMVRREAGIPVFVADFTIDLSEHGSWNVRLSEGDVPILEITVSRGGVLRETGMKQTLFGTLDGELLRVRTDTRFVGRMRLGGGILNLAGEHPVAVALRALDVAHRAIVTSTFANGEIVLHRPSRVGPAHPLACHPGIDGRDGFCTARYAGMGPIEETGAAGPSR